MLKRSAHRTREVAPVFVIGLPRSGTTLFYQLMLNNFQCSYFTRWSECFHSTPVTAYRIQRLLFPEPRLFAYESVYGRFKDASYLTWAWRPVDGHAIWHRWFPQQPTHCCEAQLSADGRDEMRSTIAGFVSVSGKPFLNKNTRNSIRLIGLIDAFPNAAVIVVNRKSVYVAQSLYIARLRQGSARHNTSQWWGTKPREFIHLRCLDPMRQAVGQTRAIERELARQLEFCRLAYKVVDYEDLCQRPGEVLRQVHEFCRGHGIRLEAAANSSVAPFRTQDTRKISETEFETLRRLLDQIEMWGDVSKNSPLVTH